MISTNEINILWGANGIILPSPATLADAAIPASSKAFLSSVGLPRAADLFVTFDISGGALPTLSEFAEPIYRPIPSRFDRFYRIGADGGAQVCLTMGSGEVVAVDVLGKLPDRFINSTIQQFIECLRLFRTFSERTTGLRDEEIDRMIPEFVDDLQAIDMNALADRENWWSLVVEQMRDGQL